MARIIDLDFYRKFKIVLPLRPRSAQQRKKASETTSTSKTLRRRPKTETQKTGLFKKLKE